MFGQHLLTKSILKIEDPGKIAFLNIFNVFRDILGSVKLISQTLVEHINTTERIYIQMKI